MTTCTTCGQPLPTTPTPSTGREWTLDVPVPMIGHNKGIGNKGTRWQRVQYAKHRDSIITALCALRPRDAWPAQKPRHVTITRLMGKRQRAYDEDNLRAACKAYLDAMKPPRAGHYSNSILVPARQGAFLLVDDSPRWLTLSVAQERAKESGVRITIKEAA